MEDFIGRVGQSYLERKAFAMPQQLENLAKQQFTGGGEKEANIKESAKGKTVEDEEEGKEEGKRTIKKKGGGKPAGQPSSGSSGKDKEIARLKKELARSRLEKPKVSSGKSALGLKKSGISKASNGQKAVIKQVAKGDKETKELAALEAVEAVGGKDEKRKERNGKKEASGRKPAKEANLIEITPTKRRTSTTHHHEHDNGAKSEHGGKPKSEHGGHAESTMSNAAVASEGKRRVSIASHSERGGFAKSIAPVHDHLPSHAARSGEERALVVSQRSRSEQRHERGLYAVEVEEEVPRRRWKDGGGVVEVESSKGRMLYRVG